MAVAVASVTTRGSWTSTTGGSNSTILNKPTGLAEGDHLLCLLVTSTGTMDISTPSGWTAVGSKNGREFIFWKEANSSDVAASTFTFNADEAGSTAGVLYRITGGSFNDLLVDDGTDTDNDPTIPVSVTPYITGSLVVLLFQASESDTIGGTWTNQGITGGGTITFTERVDFWAGASVDWGGTVVDGLLTGASEITEMTGTIDNGASSTSFYGAILVIPPPTDGDGTHEQLAGTLTANTNNVTSSTNPTTAQLEMTAITYDASEEAINPTRWDNIDKS